MRRGRRLREIHKQTASAASESTKVAFRRWLPWLLFAAVLTLRLFYVSLFASNTPFWDQWDAEADRLLRPWVEGNWGIHDLFAAHNEHRIAVTRLLSLALFSLNDQHWDNLVEAYANAAVFAAMIAMFYAFLCAGESVRWISGAMFASVLVIAALPFGWENFLVGFQNQFYFMAILAIAMVGIVALRSPDRTSLLLLTVLGIAGLFTMASGLLAPVAAMAVVVLRNLREPLRPIVLLAFAIFLGGVCVAGLLILPDVPPHAVFKAHGVGEHLAALATTSMWPWQPLDPSSTHWRFYWRAGLALAIWAPSGLWAVRFAHRRVASNNELFAAGIAFWVALQILAIAHSRGHEIVAVTSRYTEILALGVLINLWFVLRLLAGSPQAAARGRNVLVAGAYCAFVAVALVRRTPADLHAMVERSQATRVQTQNVQAYVASGDVRNLQKPFFQLPYPDAERLRSLLDNPTIRAMLPVSIKATPAGGTPASTGPLSIAALRLQRAIRPQSSG